VVGDELEVEKLAPRRTDLLMGLEVKFELSGRLAVEQAVEADDRPRTAARSLTARRWTDVQWSDPRHLRLLTIQRRISRCVPI